MIFDASTKPFPWGPIWASVGCFAFGCVLLILKKLKWRYALSNTAGFLFMLAAVVTAAINSIGWQVSHNRRVKSLASGDYKVVQGMVEDFHPMPDDGSSNESFKISGNTFYYSDYSDLDATTCFNRTVYRHGPIQQGIHLRIKFVDHCILQIEEVAGSSAIADQ